LTLIAFSQFECRGFEPKELHRVWQTGALIEDFENLDSYEADELDSEGAATPAAALAPAPVPPKKVIDVIVPTSLAQANRQNSALGKGKLSQMLQKERNNFAAVKATASTSSRLRGVYQRTVAQTQALPPLPSATTSAAPVDSALDRILGGGNPVGGNPLAPAKAGTTSAAVAADASTEDAAPVCHVQTSKILRNPFAQSGAALPQVQAKRNRKNLTFALVSIFALSRDLCFHVPHQFRQGLHKCAIGPPLY
jgi:hypothetical protein